MLLGTVNPSGRLPFTWYADQSQLPAIGDYSIRPSASSLGRTYMYFRGKVAYPSRYGLSYSKIAYSDVSVARSRVGADGTITVRATVTNLSRRAGSEVAQVYVTTPDAAPALQRPIKRLEAFTKVSLRPHQHKRVTFTIPVRKRAFFDEASNRYVVDQGRYGIQLARPAGTVVAQRIVTVRGRLTPKPAVVTAKPVVAGDAARGIAQRVLVPRGSRLDPQLTVSMSDESRYGYITKGQSTPRPAGTKVSYRSDRPSVVQVRGGRLVATSRGVATVTATVRRNGGTATGSFVIDVQ